MAIAKTTDITEIWKFLIKQGFTKAGAAGLMGNMYAESGIIPNRVEILCLKRLRENGQNYNDATYTAAVDNGSINRATFLNPLPGKQYGYGLCQWTSPGRKAGLYDLCKSKGKSIGDRECQLEWLMKELQTNYQSVYNTLKSTSSIRTASDIVLQKFEIPANWSSYSNTRASYGQEIYNMCAAVQVDTSSSQSNASTSTAAAFDFTPYKGKISNSGGDERGSARGGQAGDQTGNEWVIRGWYNRPWNCVLRYPDAKVRNLIAELAIEAANNNKIGYDQNERYTYWSQLQKVGYRPSKITVACEADCSAGVIANVKAAGHLLGISKLQNYSATYTGNMRSAAQAIGFQVLTESKYLNGTEYLLPGDILLNDVHHTATNLGIGVYASFTPTPATSDIVAVDYADSLDKSLAGKYTVQAATSLRSGASTSKKELAKLAVGATVENFGYYTNDWLYVKYGSQTGFVEKSKVSKGGSSSSTTPSTPSSSSSSSSNGKGELNTTPQWVGKVVNASKLNVRSYAGTNYPNIKSYPILNKGNLVDVCDDLKDTAGNKWYYIRIAGKIYGFVSAKYIQKV